MSRSGGSPITTTLMAGTVFRALRAISFRVHRRPSDHRPVLRHRLESTIHHEWRQSCADWSQHLSLRDFRTWLGCWGRCCRFRRRQPGRHAHWSGCVDRHRGDDLARRHHRAGAIIAARSVVTRDVPRIPLSRGNPARPVKARFDADTIDRLLDLAWWDWPVDKITRALPAIRAGDLDALEAVR